MSNLIAFLRAVNVGGTGKITMTTLRGIAQAAGLTDVRSYIQSGNLVFDAPPGLDAKRVLEERLERHFGQPVGVVLRTASELRDVAACNPFPEAEPSRVAVLFLDTAVPRDAASAASGQADERIVPGHREIYIHYPSGMGRSKLRLPQMAHGTSRNINTVERLVEMATSV